MSKITSFTIAYDDGSTQVFTPIETPVPQTETNTITPKSEPQNETGAVEISEAVETSPVE